MKAMKAKKESDRRAPIDFKGVQCARQVDPLISRPPDFQVMPPPATHVISTAAPSVEQLEHGGE